MGPPPSGAMGAVPPSPGFQGAQGPRPKTKIRCSQAQKNHIFIGVFGVISCPFPPFFNRIW